MPYRMVGGPGIIRVSGTRYPLEKYTGPKGANSPDSLTKHNALTNPFMRGLSVARVS